MEKLAVKIPFLYTLYSRGGGLSIVNNYVYGPTILIAYALFMIDSVTIPLVIGVSVLSYVLFAMVYEIGYMINDLWAIKYEEKPTLRTEVEYSVSDILKFISIRVTVVFVVLSLVWLFDYQSSFFLTKYTWLLAILLVVYILHNFIHLFDMRLRILTFSLLKVAFWFIPAFYFFLLLKTEESLAYVLIFLGALLFYLYSYMTAKKIINQFLKKWLPYDLELRLLLAITVVVLPFVPFMSSDFYIFVGFVYLYFMFFWCVRLFGRYYRNFKK